MGDRERATAEGGFPATFAKSRSIFYPASRDFRVRDAVWLSQGSNHLNATDLENDDSDTLADWQGQIDS
jgi:hypothetical protein